LFIPTDYYVPAVWSYPINRQPRFLPAWEYIFSLAKTYTFSHVSPLYIAVMSDLEKQKCCTCLTDHGK
jgi:hypothetical protein